MGRRLGAIALLAILVRAVVPAGYMLAEADTANGRYLTVQICTGHDTAARVIDLDTGKTIDASKIGKTDKSGKPDPKSAPCVFAGAPVLAQPAAAAEPVEFVAQTAVKFDLSRDLRPGRGIPAPPPPSTGPPSLI